MNKMSEKENENTGQEMNEQTVENNADNAAEETVENVQEQTNEEVKAPSPEEQLAELNNKYVRLYSDFDNFRKRTIKEKADIISTANGGLMSDLLGVLDDFERAIANNEKVEDAESLREGFKLIYNKFSTTLKNKGLEAMDCKGDVFDGDLHEAVTNIPAPTEEDKGKIVDVIERGYNLKGKVLRYAKVVVGQ
jgi:molecular chaperone GrpE